MIQKELKRIKEEADSMAWVIKEQVGIALAKLEGTEAELIRVKEEVRVLRLKNAQLKQQLEKLQGHALQSS